MEEKKKKNPAADVYAVLHDFVYILAVITLVFVFVIRLEGVSGPSMTPTLLDGEYMALLSTFISRDYEQGDIVVATVPTIDDARPIVKRVIALEGQTVDIDFGAGIVYVDGEALEEDYIREPTWMSEDLDFPMTVPEGHIFVLGDNRNNSSDSRHKDLGPIDTRMVVGKAVVLAVPGVTKDLDTREWNRVGLLQ